MWPTPYKIQIFFKLKFVRIFGSSEELKTWNKASILGFLASKLLNVLFGACDQLRASFGLQGFPLGAYNLWLPPSAFTMSPRKAIFLVFDEGTEPPDCNKFCQNFQL